jgi:hypothetical protein
LEDIEKIREYAGERFMSVPKEEFRAEMRESSARMQKKLKEIRENHITQRKSRVEQVV